MRLALIGLLLVATTVSAQAPLTDLERKDIEILTLKAQLAAAYKRLSDVQAELGTCAAVAGPAQFEQNKQTLSDEQAALKDRIEKARPGYTWDPQTGAFTPKPKDQGGPHGR